MAAAAANRNSKRKEADLVAHPIAASVTIYEQTLVSARVADGFTYPARSGTATDMFQGVAYEPAVGNGVAGGKNVRVWKTGTYSFAGTGFVATDVGAAVYASDDQTVTKTATNNQLVGYIQEVISATEVRVRIDRAVN